jgi:glutathione S-transferase
MKIYDFLPCPFGQKVRIVLAEKSLTYELIQVDLAQGEQRRPEFRRLNPFGRVPVLVDEETTIYDSTVIIEYLEDEYPEPPVLPPLGSSALRARARLLEDFADTSFTPRVGQLMAEMARPEGDRDPNRIQQIQRNIELALDYVNHELGGQQFLAGEFSIADIGFVPRLLVLGELGIEVGANRPGVDAWSKRLIERASVQTLQGITVQPLAGV